MRILGFGSFLGNGLDSKTATKRFSLTANSFTDFFPRGTMNHKPWQDFKNVLCYFLAWVEPQMYVIPSQDDESDLEFELEPVPPVSMEVAGDVSMCVKVFLKTQLDMSFRSECMAVL